MTLHRDILPDDHPILHTPTNKLNFDDSDLVNPNDLYDILAHNIEQYKGIGLAANQIGLSISAFMIKTLNGLNIYINPEIKDTSIEEEYFTEGCLSFPGLEIKIKRPTRVLAQYYDVEGKIWEKEISGIEARVYQHELDHLKGITFINRSNKFNLRNARRKRIANLRKL